MSSDDNLPEIVIEEPTTDIVGKDAQKLKEFMEAGLPGYPLITEEKLARIFDLYLIGKTYSQIADIMQIKKALILYLSHKLDWYEARKTFLEDLNANIKRRVIEAKLLSQDFLIQMLQMWHKKIGAKMNRYMLTNNEEFTNQINLKEIDRYLKTLELLQKSIGDPFGNNKVPTIGVNVGDGMTIVKKGENSVEITPKQRAVGEMLKQFADLARQEEKK